MKKKHWIVLILLFLPQQLYATTISYTFNGTATVEDPNGILLETFPDIVDFSGSFTTNPDIVSDCGIDCVAYEAYEFQMLLNGYNVYGMSQSISNLWWIFDDQGNESELGYSMIEHDIPVDNISWSELFLHFNVSPENAADFSSGSFNLLIVSDYSSNIKDMYFTGSIDTFETITPVPEPTTMLLFSLGLAVFGRGQHNRKGAFGQTLKKGSRKKNNLCC